MALFLLSAVGLLSLFCCALCVIICQKRTYTNNDCFNNLPKKDAEKWEGFTCVQCLTCCGLIASFRQNKSEQRNMFLFNNLVRNGYPKNATKIYGVQVY